MAYETRQSKLLRSFLQGLGGAHISVAELSERLPEKIGTATIYRQLERLEAQGLVRKYITDGEPACYQYVGNSGDCHGHFHLKCAVCGRLIHLECESFDRLTRHILQEHGFQVDPLRTALYGICKDCLEEQNRL